MYAESRLPDWPESHWSYMYMYVLTWLNIIKRGTATTANSITYSSLLNWVNRTHMLIRISTCTSSIPPRLWVLLLPAVRSPTHELLTWADLVPVEEQNGEVHTKGSMSQWLPRTSTPQQACSSYNIIITKTFTLKTFVARLFLRKFLIWNVFTQNIYVACLGPYTVPH